MQTIINTQKHRDIYFIQKLLGKRLAEQFEALEFDPTATDEMWQIARHNPIVYRSFLIAAITAAEEVEED